jgi:hypothetical protein
MPEVFHHFQADMQAVDISWQMRHEHHPRDLTHSGRNRPKYDLSWRGVTRARVVDLPDYNHHLVNNPDAEELRALGGMNWDLHVIGDGRLLDGSLSGRLATCDDVAIGDIISRSYDRFVQPSDMVYRMRFVCRLQYPNDSHLLATSHALEGAARTWIDRGSQRPRCPVFKRALARREFQQRNPGPAHTVDDELVGDLVANWRARTRRKLGLAQPEQTYWNPTGGDPDTEDEQDADPNASSSH